jgi:hypothetical protein
MKTAAFYRPLALLPLAMDDTQYESPVSEREGALSEAGWGKIDASNAGREAEL